MAARRGTKITEKQKKVLIEQVKQLPTLVSGKFSATFTHKNAEQEWRRITTTLNSMGGAEKEWKMWRKTWQDLRSRTKTKISNNKIKANKTGGGEADEELLSNIEEDILDIIKPVSVEGHNIEESSTEFHFESSENQPNTETGSVAISLNTSPLTISPTDIPTVSSKLLDDHVESTQHLLSTTVTTAKKLPKKVQNLINVAAAATSFKENLETKTNIKEKYYKRKLEICEEMLILKQRKVAALEKIAEILANTMNTK